MAKAVDGRLVEEILIESISYKPNVERVSFDEEGIETITYVVLTRITYILLDIAGKRLVRTTRNHDLAPLPNTVTGVQFINNLAILAPLIKAAAIADRNELINP